MIHIPIRKQKDWEVSPFSELENLQKELNRFFGLSFPRLFDGETTFPVSQWAPAIDVYDSKDDIIVKADLPGLNKEEINIAIQENMLTIKGEKKKESEIKEDDYVRLERFYGSFHRTVHLPSEVKADQAKANFKDGVLELTLPKQEKSKPKQITIDVK